MSASTMLVRPRLSAGWVRDHAGPSDECFPTPAMLALPERAVQFGTGGFLRGFVDVFVDEANRAGRFNGRIVAIGSTGSGRDAMLSAQDGLYTVVTRGIEQGAVVESSRVVSSVSRAVSASSQWDQVLACARNPDLRLIFSNTTEIGFACDAHDAPEATPPVSFPAKLTRFLIERARTFPESDAASVFVVPCELLDDNGTKLQQLVESLLRRWEVSADIQQWIARHVRFCNTLVDRIVPGAPSAEERERLAAVLGYEDALLITAEPYRLFAIEGDDAVQAQLGFAEGNAGVVVTPDVTPYRRRKVRLLNGGHTQSVPLAILSGCTTVNEMMQHPVLRQYVHALLHEDMVPTLEDPLAAAFATDVLDRFANPFIQHALKDITLQGTMKWRVRVLPSLLRAVEMRGTVPPLLALGFAALVLFMRGEQQAAWLASGVAVPPDASSERWRMHWDTVGPVGTIPPTVERLHALVLAVLADTTVWEYDMRQIPGFATAVTTALAHLMMADAGALPDVVANTLASGTP